MKIMTTFMRRHLPIVPIVLIVASACLTVTAGEPPRGIGLSPSAEGYRLTFSGQTFQLSPITEAGETFDRLTVPEYGTSSEAGLPQLPQVSFNLIIPDAQSVPVISIDKCTTRDFPLEKRLYPVQQPWPKSRPLAERPFSINAGYYASEGVDAPWISVSEPFEIGGIPGVTVTIRPFRYHPKSGLLQAIETMSAAISLPARAKMSQLQPASAFSAFAGRHFVNSNELTTAAQLLKAPDNYLIISSPALQSSCARFVTYRQRLGFNVALFSTSETGTTTTAIKSFIQARYDNTSTRPAYILLVGDVTDIPAWATTTPDNPWTDLYYATLAGSDYFPDAGIGRFSATSAAQLVNMINKTIYMDSLVDNIAKNATFLASTDNYSITEGTHNYVISNDMSTAGYTSQRRYSYTYSATTQQVLNDLAAGMIFCVYSGHGSETSWADGPPVSQSQVRALGNAIFPFVYSFSCLTGSYSSTPECFGESWVRIAAGASSYWGSSVTSYWTEDDILERAVFDAIFQDGITLNGPSFYEGKMALYNQYGNTSTIQRYFEMYNLMGDPALALYNNWTPGVALQYRSSAITETTGNNDGIINPGERISLLSSLVNRGTVDATGVAATISTADSYVTVVDNASQFGAVAARGGSTGAADPFVLQIAANCPTPRTVALRLTITDGTGATVTSDFSLSILTSSQISGHVYVRGTTTPIPNAVVSWTGPGTGSVLVDASGAYSFTATNGTYSVAASAPNYFPSLPQSVTTPPGVADLEFQLGRPHITTTPSSITESIQAGTTLDRTLQVNNTGTDGLTYAIAIRSAQKKAVPAESLYSADHFVTLEKGTPDTRLGLPAGKGHGGPDVYGYRWMDSDEPGGPVYQWDDISSTGQMLSLNGDDVATTVALSFAFPFYGADYTSLSVCSNGFITFGASSTTYSNQPFPSTSAPNALIAAFWDDLRAANNVYFRDYTDRAVIQFQNVSPYSGAGTYTFQVVITAQGKITLFYRTMTGTLTSASIGIENAGGTDGLGVAYNTAYLHDNMAVCFQAAPDWISVTPETGNVPAGQSRSIQVHFSSQNLVPGTYACSLFVEHNDPVTSTPLSIPVSLAVTTQPVLRLMSVTTGISSVAADRAGQQILENSIVGSPAAGRAAGSRFRLHLK
jgi:hypothetical protein